MGPAGFVVASEVSFNLLKIKLFHLEQQKKSKIVNVDYKSFVAYTFMPMALTARLTALLNALETSWH